jgi:GDP-4-dehydro-6-deoxy-D-mannose reductase
MAQRVMALKRGQAKCIPAGNVDVRRDLTDVRDVVAAYRLMLEAAYWQSLADPFTVVNVASGDAVTIRFVIERLCDLAGATPVIETQGTLVRAGDPLEIRGDATRIRELVGWQPRIRMEQTLSDMLAAL